MAVNKASLPVVEPVDGVVGVTAPTQAQLIGGTDGSLLRAVKTDTLGNLLTSGRVPLTASAPASVMLGTVSAALVASNANRRGLVISNTGAQRISLGFGVTAVLDTGISIQPAQQFIMTDFTFTTAAINGVSAGASTKIAIQEFT